MTMDFRQLYQAMYDALDVGWLEIRAQRALIALLENRLSHDERQFWLSRAESNGFTVDSKQTVAP